MCEFISFFVSVKKNSLVCGDPNSHSNTPVHSGLEDWREAEWTDKGLEIRINPGEDLNAYKVTVLAKVKTRAGLCKFLSGSKDLDGNRYWFNTKGLHRLGDKPAYVWAGGNKSWYKNGQHHRDGDEPACIWADGSQEWYKNGQHHRDGDEPACIWADGSQEWYKNGQRHRDGDEPACIWASGNQEW